MQHRVSDEEIAIALRQAEIVAPNDVLLGRV